MVVEVLDQLILEADEEVVLLCLVVLLTRVLKQCLISNHSRLFVLGVLLKSTVCHFERFAVSVDVAEAH